MHWKNTVQLRMHFKRYKIAYKCIRPTSIILYIIICTYNTSLKFIHRTCPLHVIANFVNSEKYTLNVYLMYEFLGDRSHHVERGLSQNRLWGKTHHGQYALRWLSRGNEGFLPRRQWWSFAHRQLHNQLTSCRW